MSSIEISTHVLDTAKGKPAVGVEIILEAAMDGKWKEIARGDTDANGRVVDLLPAGSPEAADFRLRFDTYAYFRATGQAVFYPEVLIHVRLEPGAKYHLPLLLSPFGYSTYRGG